MLTVLDLMSKDPNPEVDVEWKSKRARRVRRVYHRGYELLQSFGYCLKAPHLDSYASLEIGISSSNPSKLTGRPGEALAQ